MPKSHSRSFLTKLHDSLLKKDALSWFERWVLNRVLFLAIPFNAPHKIQVWKLKADSVEVLLPYRRKNLNHLRSLHACALATAAEFACGLALIRHLGMGRYRLIMQNIQVTYLKQGRADAFARCHASRDWIQTAVLEPLKTSESVSIPLQVSIADRLGTELCQVSVLWQVKPWDKVRLPPESRSS